MACNLDDLLIDNTDFNCITDVAFSCDIDRMCPFIREAQETLLVKHIGWGLLDEVLKNKANYQELLCGSVFEYCGKKQKHFGLKRVLVFYAYGLYKMRSSMTDTQYGTVQKLVADSVPLNYKDLNQLKIENFRLAKEYWQQVEKYLCANKEDNLYKEFDTCNCTCECGNCNNKTGTGKARKRQVKTFKKYGNNNNYKQGRQPVYDAGRCNCNR